MIIGNNIPTGIEKVTIDGEKVREKIDFETKLNFYPLKLPYYGTQHDNGGSYTTSGYYDEAPDCLRVIKDSHSNKIFVYDTISKKRFNLLSCTWETYYGEPDSEELKNTVTIDQNSGNTQKINCFNNTCILECSYKDLKINGINYNHLRNFYFPSRPDDNSFGNNNTRIINCLVYDSMVIINLKTKHILSVNPGTYITYTHYGATYESILIYPELKKVGPY